MSTCLIINHWRRYRITAVLIWVWIIFIIGGLVGCAAPRIQPIVAIPIGEEVHAVLFSADGQRMAVASSTKVHVWQIEPPLLLQTIDVGSPYRRHFTFSSDGQMIAISNTDPQLGTQVQIWQVSNGQLAQEFIVETITGLQLHPNGDVLASGDTYGRIHLWDVEHGSLIRTLEARDSSSLDFVQDIRFHGDLIVASSRNVTVRMWNLTDGRLLDEITTWHNDGSLLENLLPLNWDSTVSPDTDLILSWYLGGNIDLWQRTTQAHLQRFTGEAQILTVAISPDQRWVAAGSGDQEPDDTGRYQSQYQLWVWRTATGEELFEYANHTDNVSSVVFSPDGRFFASGSRDGTVHVWEVADFN